MGNVGSLHRATGGRTAQAATPSVRRPAPRAADNLMAVVGPIAYAVGARGTRPSRPADPHDRALGVLGVASEATSRRSRSTRTSSTGRSAIAASSSRTLGASASDEKTPALSAFLFPGCLATSVFGCPRRFISHAYQTRRTAEGGGAAARGWRRRGRRGGSENQVREPHGD